MMRLDLEPGPASPRLLDQMYELLEGLRRHGCEVSRTDSGRITMVGPRSVVEQVARKLQENGIGVMVADTPAGEC